jgi:hypothetical protein
MANHHRGDVAFELEGDRIDLRLTLQQLAELEEAFGADGLAAMARRLAEGPLSARDIVTVLAAGFRGGGRTVTAEELARRIPADHLALAAAAAVRLIATSLDIAPLGGGATSHPPPPQVA